MSYASAKGRKGQYEVRDFLDNLFKEFGFNFISISGSEKNKKIMAGDVLLNTKSDPYFQCLLGDYFLEVKNQAQPNIFADLAKAQDDSYSWGKRGPILFAIKQKRGQFGPNASQKVVVMSWKVFAFIIKELQGYRVADTDKGSVADTDKGSVADTDKGVAEQSTQNGLKSKQS